MRLDCLILVGLGLGFGLGGCQSGNSDSPRPSPAKGKPSAGGGPDYAGDIDRICNVVAYSGALDDPSASLIVATAQWLGANLRTDDGRAFLATLQPLSGAAKADALDAEAKRTGLASCPLADRWR